MIQLKFRIQHSKPLPESFIIRHKDWKAHFQNDINHKDQVQLLLTLVLRLTNNRKSRLHCLRIFHHARLAGWAQWFWSPCLIHNQWRLFTCIKFKNMIVHWKVSLWDVTVVTKAFIGSIPSAIHVSQYSRWNSAWLIFLLEYSICLASRNHCHTPDRTALEGKRSEDVISVGLVGCYKLLII